MKVSYHPEFLYFNDYVRRHGFDPEKNPEEFHADKRGMISCYEAFNKILKEMEFPDAKEPEKLASIARKLLPEVSRGTTADIDGWISYAKSLEIESMLKKYSGVIFDYVGVEFEIPEIVVYPVRLGPWEQKDFGKILSGKYKYEDIEEIDPPNYDLLRHRIYFPIPEKKMRIPRYKYGATLVHEIIHVPLRFAYGGVFKFGSYTFKSPYDEIMTCFSEVFSEACAICVIMRADVGSKNPHAEEHFNSILGQPGLFGAGLRLMTGEYGFRDVCRMLLPIFLAHVRMSFMVSEWNKIRKLSKSELRDTLVKEHKLFKEAVRGMEKKELQSQLARRIIGTIKRLLDEMKKANVQALFGQALEREKDKKKRKALTMLITLFSEELLPEWRKAI
jgi:hypothetical protein